MVRTSVDQFPRPDTPPKSRAVRLSERVNRAARRLRRELETMACAMPAQRPARRGDLLLTAAALGAGTAGLVLLTRVALRPVPSGLDVAATRLLQHRQPPPVTRGMLLISMPGFAPLQHALTIGTALDLWAFGHRREALFAMLTMGGGATTGLIKVLVGRPRPDPAYMRAIFQFRDNSFPSGHCTHYASFYGYLFYLAHRCMAASPLRTAILASCAGLIILVAPSRVYLGHHWTSDVLAGDLVGLTYLFTLIKVYEHVWVRQSPGVAPGLAATTP